MSESALFPGLCDALLDLRLVPATAPLNERRRVADGVRLVMKAMRRFLDRRRNVQPVDRDTVLQKLVVRFAKKGPMRGKAGAPATDLQAAKWLAKCIKRAVIDMFREVARRRRHDSLEQAINPHLEHQAVSATDSHLNPEESLERAQRLAARERQIRAANSWLDAKTTELVEQRNARRKGTGTQLAKHLEQIRQAAQGQLDINKMVRDELLRQEGHGADAPVEQAAFKKLRNQYDARYKRARRALYDYTEDCLMEHGHEDPELVRALRKQRLDLR